MNIIAQITDYAQKEEYFVAKYNNNSHIIYIHTNFNHR